MQNEDKKRKKSSIGYYSVVAFSLAVIGSVSWFAATRGSAGKKSGEYPQSNQSYNSSRVQSEASDTAEKTESAAKAVENEPYSAPEQSSQPQSEPEKSAFTMPVEGTIQKPYSRTDLQYSSTYNDLRLHEGVDIRCEEGSVVKAAYNGTVTDVTDDPLYGKVVVIDHGSGVSVRYCGLKEATVNTGQSVVSGEQIGFSGNVPCECADEPHIHIDATTDSDSISAFEILSAAQ